MRQASQPASQRFASGATSQLLCVRLSGRLRAPFAKLAALLLLLLRLLLLLPICGHSQQQQQTSSVTRQRARARWLSGAEIIVIIMYFEAWPAAASASCVDGRA